MADHELKQNTGEHPAGDKGQMLLFALFMIVWILDSFFLQLTSVTGMVPLLVRLVVAALILGLGFYLISVSHFIVDANKRPKGVVSTGAFKYVRHPVYLAALLFYLGMTITTLSLACVVLFLAILLFYNFMAGYEERLLIAKFGDDYRDYMTRTGRWLPRLGA